MRNLNLRPELQDDEGQHRQLMPLPEEYEDGAVLWLQLLVALTRAFVVLFMPLIALLLGFLVGRRFDSAWAMLGTVTVCFVAGGIFFPGEQT
jgi:lipopolysaccharide export LptBFGC system permease protein LptF